MDDTILKKGIQALQWESHYRKKHDIDPTVLKHFLAPQTTLDPDFEKHFAKLNITSGKVLDVGTGNGDLAIFLAKKGFDVTATDVAPFAINSAKQQAAIIGVTVNFLVDNILLSKLTGVFDAITDRGCYTLIPSKYKQDYIAQVKKILKPGGWLIIKSDIKKEKALLLLREDTDFREFAFEISSYQALGGKVLSAIVLVLQKTMKE
jgi:2-polyprenyl-3-methyl-5-hydroxy-6-metoxy-1,4-benzoquinol methylase